LGEPSQVLPQGLGLRHDLHPNERFPLHLHFAGAGWKLMGFQDQHAFTPPFGYYDREYTGFVPYSTEKQA